MKTSSEALLTGECYTEDVRIPIGETHIEGELNIPPRAPGVVVFAHESGGSRHSPHDQLMARTIHGAGMGILVIDLLSAEEKRKDVYTSDYRSNLSLLAERLVSAAAWLNEQPAAKDLALGFFGSSTGGTTALIAAAEMGIGVDAVVSPAGHPDLAIADLPRVQAPTLLIVGEHDKEAIRHNEEALATLKCEKELQIVPGATRLFEEEGAWEEVAHLAAKWFESHLGKAAFVKQSPANVI